jgi:hypothetical protein
LRFWSLIVCTLLCAPVAGAESRADTAEQDLIDAVLEAERGRATAAQRTLADLVSRRSNFEAASALLMDLQRGGDGSLDAVAADVSPERLAELREEIVRRRDALAFQPGDRVPSVLIQIAEDERAALVMDASRSRLYLFVPGPDGVPVLMDSFYSSVGSAGMGKQLRGDLRTPLGVFRIQYYILGEDLPDLYGAGALTLDYPTAWDRQRLRTGDGIWLHGVPAATYARAPEATRGCLAVSNDMFEAIRPVVAVGRSPVVIAERLDWVSPAQLRSDAELFTREVDRWHAETMARMAQDMEASPDLGIGVTDLSIQRVPDEQGLVLTTFTLDPGDPRIHALTASGAAWLCCGASLGSSPIHT